MHRTRYRAALAALLVAAVLAAWRCTAVAAATITFFSNSFDRQRTGALVTGTGANQFSGTRGASRLSVENATVWSPPNALAVTLAGGGSAFAYKQYFSGYTTYIFSMRLRMRLQLSATFTVPHNDYLVLAQTVQSTSSSVGKVDVTIPADNRIRLDYVDSAGHLHVLRGRFVVPRYSWHTVELREDVGAGSGSLTLLVDRHIAASGSKLDLGAQGVTWFAVGEEYAPPGRGYAGHLYIDDVTVTATT